MSFALPVTSLSGATAGTTGSVSWTHIAQSIGFPASNATPHLTLYNESPCGLQLDFRTGEQIVLPAGGWQVMPLNANCTAFVYTVLYVLNASPIVSSLLGTWYAPDEAVPNAPILGNSPIGGSVSNNIANELQGVGQSLSLTEHDDGAYIALVPTSGAFRAVEILPTDANGNPDNTAGILVSASGIGNSIRGNTSITGVLAQLSSEVTVGLGAGALVAGNGSNGTHVTTTGASTVVKASAVVNAFYRIQGWALVNNSVSGNNITFTVGYTDSAASAARTDTLPLTFSTGTLFPSGGASIANGHYLSPGVIIPTLANSTITITYRDPTNTPNDWYFVTIERLW